MADEGIRKITELQRLAAEQIDRKSAQPIGSPGFDQALAEQIKKGGQVSFSNHAIQRLQKRNIDFNSDHMERLNQAVSKLSEKGAKESLVMIDDMALVVGIKHKTVITAMDRESMKGNVITNIDSAIIT